jgi:membrane-bound metal-dependent hydrolase YbcI (DUF457 family)
MVARTHRLLGGSTGFVATTAVGLPISICAVATVIAAASSSLPDDLERWLHLSHRRATHYPSLQLLVAATIAAGAIAEAAPAVVVLSVVGAVALGCLVHSLADAMTVEQHGIALLWPISRRGYHLLPRPMRVWVGSKSRSEWAFAACWCAFVLCYVYVRYRHQIPSLGNRT